MMRHGYKMGLGHRKKAEIIEQNQMLRAEPAEGVQGPQLGTQKVLGQGARARLLKITAVIVCHPRCP